MDHGLRSSIAEINGADDTIELKHLILLEASKSKVPEGDKPVPIRMVRVSVDKQLLVDIGTEIYVDASITSASSLEDVQPSTSERHQPPKPRFMSTGDPKFRTAPVIYDLLSTSGRYQSPKAKPSDISTGNATFHTDPVFDYQPATSGIYHFPKPRFMSTDDPKFHTAPEIYDLLSTSGRYQSPKAKPCDISTGNATFHTDPVLDYQPATSGIYQFSKPRFMSTGDPKIHTAPEIYDLLSTSGRYQSPKAKPSDISTGIPTFDTAPVLDYQPSTSGIYQFPKPRFMSTGDPKFHTAPEIYDLLSTSGRYQSPKAKPSDISTGNATFHTDPVFDYQPATSGIYHFPKPRFMSTDDPKFHTAPEIYDLLSTSSRYQSPKAKPSDISTGIPTFDTAPVLDYQPSTSGIYQFPKPRFMSTGDPKFHTAPEIYDLLSTSDRYQSPKAKPSDISTGDPTFHTAPVLDDLLSTSGRYQSPKAKPSDISRGNATFHTDPVLDYQPATSGIYHFPKPRFMSTDDPKFHTAPEIPYEHPMCILYIGDLDQRITEDLLRMHFERYTAVKSVALQRDPTTMQSIGSAFVTFFHPADADRMRTTLNGVKIMNKPIRIMKYQPNPESSNTEGNLFVKNLHPTIENQTLYNIFAIYGTVLSCKVMRRDGKSLCYGYVQFESKDVAKKAMEKLNGSVHFGRKIKVQAFQSLTNRIQALAPSSKIYVSNLNKSVTSKNIVSKFEKFGKIKDILITESDKNLCVTINFEDIESAKTAVNEVNGTEMNGFKLDVGFVKNKEMIRLESTPNQVAEQTEASGRNLCIKNLPPWFNDEDLFNLFSQFGYITSSRVMISKYGNRKQYGFVCYSSCDESKEAVNVMNKYNVDSYILNVTVAKNQMTDEVCSYAQPTIEYATPFTPRMEYYNATCPPPAEMSYYQPYQNHQDPYPHKSMANLHFRTDACKPTWETEHAVTTTTAVQIDKGSTSAENI